jgi:putative transposase
MLKTFEYRLYPNEDQKILIHKHIGAARWLYNWALEKKSTLWTTNKQNITRYELHAELPALKTVGSPTAWLKEVNAQSLQAAITHLDVAYSKFFRKQSAFPKFKSKKDSKQSFEIPQELEVNFDHGRVHLPKFKGGIKTRFHRQFTGQIRTCTIKRTSTNKYFVSILVEDGIPTPIKQEPVFKDSIGIDVGVKDFAVTSEGEVFENPRHFLKSQEKLKKLQQSFSRKLRLSGHKKGAPLGKNASRLKQEIALVHEQVANQRKDFLHKVSTRLIRENQSVCVEDLNVKGMMSNHKLAKHIGDLGLGMFYSFLQYKADWEGKHVLECGRWDASSKTCSKCGHYYKELTLDQRVWTCSKCGEEHHRDVNAGENIKSMAFLRYTRGKEEITSTGNSGVVSVKVAKATDGKKAKIKGSGEVLLGQKDVS